MSKSSKKPIRRFSVSDPEAIIDRVLWAEPFNKCWWCGCRRDWLPLHIHEIIRRSECNVPFQLQNYAVLCEDHHKEAHGGYVTVGHLLTLKAAFDPDNYDLVWINAAGIKRGYEPEELPEYRGRHGQ